VSTYLLTFTFFFFVIFTFFEGMRSLLAPLFCSSGELDVPWPPPLLLPEPLLVPLPCAPAGVMANAHDPATIAATKSNFFMGHSS
jgi:hypothetical protein